MYGSAAAVALYLLATASANTRLFSQHYPLILAVNGALAAGLTGRTPEYGFHLDEHRKGSFTVELKAKLDDLADWGAVGKLVGEAHQNYYAVPVFHGYHRTPTADELKHLGAALASYGSMAMFHFGSSELGSASTAAPRVSASAATGCHRSGAGTAGAVGRSSAPAAAKGWPSCAA